jgi:hypothetical protein
MLTSNLSLSTASSTRDLFLWKTTVQPHIASTHLPTYNIIGAAPRPRCPDDDVPVKAVTRRNRPSPSSSSSRKGGAVVRRTTPVTRENLSKVSMACAREEDLDAPFSSPSRPSSANRRTGSETSISSGGSTTDLPCIAEEDEEEEEEGEEAVAAVGRLIKGVAVDISKGGVTTD